MRFLDVKTLQLHNFDDASAYPPYAILSHCWYASEHELTFKDFEDLSKHTSKPGYVKIINACLAAIAQGYKWLWADNVCINTEDAIEKNETMNKLHFMFLNAGVRLLYISEIPNANTKDNDKEIFSSEAPKSRWASRAWTYSELRPSQKSVFYAADWSQLDREFLAKNNTNVLRINQYDESKGDREYSLFSSDGPTGAESLSSFISFSSAQSVNEEEHATLFNSGRNFLINQNRPSYKSAPMDSFAYRRGLSDDSGDDDVKRGPSDPQANR